MLKRSAFGQLMASSFSEWPGALLSSFSFSIRNSRAFGFAELVSYHPADFQETLSKVNVRNVPDIFVPCFPVRKNMC